MIGPKGEKRPSDVIANAVHAARIATGEAEEVHVNQDERAAGKKGLAKKTGIARWGNE